MDCFDKMKFCLLLGTMKLISPNHCPSIKIMLRINCMLLPEKVSTKLFQNLLHYLIELVPFKTLSWYTFAPR